VPPDPGGERRVLVVDDDPAVLFAYGRILTRMGIITDSCDRLPEAARLIAQHRYLAVIADVSLEGSSNRDGLEVVRLVKHADQDTKTVVVTGSGNDDVESQARQSGAFRYFVKPVQPSTVLDALCEDLKPT
jgi:DNA-binding NtrC family response regulator